MKTDPGLAAALIDTCYAAKLKVCRQWDDALGLKAMHPLSAVRALEACYTVRRPWFVTVDQVWEASFQMMFPVSRGRAAITQVNVSAFGGHKLILAEFGR